MQDNDPKHTYQLAQAYLEEQGVNWSQMPTSNALYPLKRMSVELKRYIARKVAPLNRNGLVSGSAQFWSWWMTQECLSGTLSTYTKSYQGLWQKMATSQAKRYLLVND